MSLIKKIFAHACIVLGVMFATFSILDFYNNAMNFINNDISRTLILIWAFISLITGVLFVIHLFIGENKKADISKESRASKRSNHPLTETTAQQDQATEQTVNVEMRHERNAHSASYSLYLDETEQDTTEQVSVKTEEKLTGAARYKRNRM